MFEHSRGRGHHRERFGDDPREAFRGQMRRGFGFAGLFSGRGPMVRRGDVRSAILTLLAEQPMHGYQAIQELSERSGGMWRPSAGSVYPTLQQLEDEGLVRAEDREGRRVFTLTDAGREEAARQTRGPARPWDHAAGSDAAELRRLLIQVAAATMQVSQVGTPVVTAGARRILADTRRSLYRLLAEDAGATPEDVPSAPPAD